MSGINLSPEERATYRIVNAIIQLMQGRSNAVGQVTLRAGETTTTVTRAISQAAVNVSLDSEVFLTPRTATASAVFKDCWISATGQGTFTITHPSAADADMTFGWHAIG